MGAKSEHYKLIGPKKKWQRSGRCCDKLGLNIRTANSKVHCPEIIQFEYALNFGFLRRIDCTEYPVEKLTIKLLLMSWKSGTSYIAIVVS